MNNHANDFRGLLYYPTYEHEVVLLFGLLIPYLKDSFVIDKYLDSFPDCIAYRNGEKVGIEFEVLASDFYEHGHHRDVDNLHKCNLLICWRNNIPWRTIIEDGLEFLDINGHKIEILALNKVVKSLEKDKSIKFILKGERPDIGVANQERFFEQLKENVNEEKYYWILELFKEVSRRKEFKIGWGRGKRWFTMRFYIKRWNIDPIGVTADGKIWISYQGNPAISPWKLPKETEIKLRSLFKHKKQKWPTAPLNTKNDLERIRTAIKILAEDSQKYNIVWLRSM